MNFCKCLHRIFSGVALVLAAPVALAQAWPERPVRIIVPYAAGGNTDLIARQTAQILGEAFGKTFVADNRPGANGVIAAELAAKSDADGYTLMIAAAPQLIIAPALGKVPFDPIKDFSPVSIVATNPFVLVAHRSVAAANVKELIELARGNPGKLSYATAGTGSISHLAAEMFLQRIGARAQQVSYKGNAPALVDVLAGHVPIMFANVSEALPHASGGNVRLLAVTSAMRTAQLPGVPTLAESGLAGFHAITWNGLVAPARTPQTLVERISVAVRQGIKTPSAIKRFSELGVDLVGSTPAQFSERIRADLPLWAEAVKTSGARID
jgi:tripartite-type tricarboxylate transporter receptor subunit TctC